MSGIQINQMVAEYSSEFDYNKKETAIILAAGHGKRIKSQTSKMLHLIWETPTVVRVLHACNNGLSNPNIILVVGIKAEDVIKTVGKRDSLIYAFQEVQNGTGHAVQVALEKIDTKRYDGTIYIFPGDMGLIDAETVDRFKNDFVSSGTDMMVLTGIYEGAIEENYYGRILRVKEKDAAGVKTGKEKGKVIEILEYKDILNIDERKGYKVKYGRKEFRFSKKELIENREFNSGVFAFKFKPLVEQIKNIRNDNVQGEIYLTDLIALFNRNKYSVGAVSPTKQHVLMGFNNKSVLKEMDAIARKLAYEKIKDIIMIDDPDDFFISDEVIDQLLEFDGSGKPLDIKIGKGVYVGSGVKLNYCCTLLKNAHLAGDIQLGPNVSIHENTSLSCFYGQKIVVGGNVVISAANTIKGNVTIGEGSIIESFVRITGSDEFPVHIGRNNIIKGVSYLFGSSTDDNIQIEHSILLKKQISKPDYVKGDSYRISFYMPEPEGVDAVKNLKK